MAKRTASLWGKPPNRYYRYLELLDGTFTSKPISLAILGCADGKFVLPAVRRGYRLFAIDVDEVALYGGVKDGLNGPTHMPGLLERLRTEGLEHDVEVVHGDFVKHRADSQFNAVLTSGAVQYSRNLNYSFEELVSAIQGYVQPGGFLYVDYMLPWEEKYKGRPICPGKESWSKCFPRSNWEVFYNRVLPPTLDRAHVEFPVDHYHQWGHLLARKVESK